jgi:glycosyltransferase involved in cell wall biosynthesis
VKLAVVVQRYGQAINGGAELHARYIAEGLARRADVDVLSTCATDYVTWRNELRPGDDTVNGVRVRRFPVSQERSPATFGRLSEKVFTQPHAIADELAWLDAEGPCSPALIAHLAQADYDYCFFVSARYYHAYHGARACPAKAILVPTAERDPAVALAVFAPLFRGVRALMYNSPEERAMIEAVSQNESVPSVVVGIGSEVPSRPDPERFRRKFNMRDPFAIYVGRIDENKGCRELFHDFEAYRRGEAGRLSLVLVGNSIVPIPDDPRIRHLGFLDDADKFDAIAAADVLIMPSYFESLSMVALEAWALGRPVLANGKCDVLKGQCLRSNAGLFYDGPEEFVEALRAIERNDWLRAGLGANGRLFYQHHYDWPVVERKYLDMLDRLQSEVVTRAMEPLPTGPALRDTVCRPAAEVLAELPAGPALADDVDRTPLAQPSGPRSRSAASSSLRPSPSPAAPGPSSHSRRPGRSDAVGTDTR